MNAMPASYGQSCRSEMNGGTPSSDPPSPPPPMGASDGNRRITWVAKNCALPSIAPNPAVNASSSHFAAIESSRPSPKCWSSIACVSSWARMNRSVRLRSVSPM